MKKVLYGLVAAVMTLTLSTTPVLAGQKDLIVIAAPSIEDTHDDPYYAEVFDDIIEFDIGYANAVLGHDDILILVDQETRHYFEGGCRKRFW